MQAIAQPKVGIMRKVWAMCGECRPTSMHRIPAYCNKRRLINAGFASKCRMRSLRKQIRGPLVKNTRIQESKLSLN